MEGPRSRLIICLSVGRTRGDPSLFSCWDRCGFRTRWRGAGGGTGRLVELANDLQWCTRLVQGPLTSAAQPRELLTSQRRPPCAKCQPRNYLHTTKHYPVVTVLVLLLRLGEAVLLEARPTAVASLDASSKVRKKAACRATNNKLSAAGRERAAVATAEIQPGPPCSVSRRSSWPIYHRVLAGGPVRYYLLGSEVGL